MKAKSLLLLVVLFAAGILAVVPTVEAAQVSGQYLEARTADVYTGPCFANAEVNLTGNEAVLAWRIDQGRWGNVPLEGLSVVAVVRASSTLGDPYRNPLPAKAVVIVDARASEAQRQALVRFAQAQAGGLLSDIVAIEAAPIRFDVDRARHGYAVLEAGDSVRLTTRAINDSDHICRNEEVYYPPLAAHLGHAMPAVAARSAYQGNHLGATWDESGRRNSFVGTFSF